MRLLPLIALIALACNDSKDDTADGSLADDTGTTDPGDDADGDGWDADEDCDDGDASVNPDAEEICDGVDNNCDGAIDEGVTETWYRDADGDGVGDSGDAVEACGQPDGYVAGDGDCDDGDPDVYPDAAERCDGIDNDCDGEVDEDVQDVWYLDADLDGYGDPDNMVEDCDPPEYYVADGTDCEDTEPEINPGATEVCNGFDDDCDGLIDDDDDSVTDLTTWYGDADGDGFGDAATTFESCEQPSGTSATADDCDDADAAVNPDAAEVCNGIDDDCDGDTDDADADVTGASTWYADADGDGYGDAATPWEACDQPTSTVDNADDCDDTDGDTSPDGEEVCDGIDNDCDGSTDGSDSSDATTWYTDADADGYGDAASTTVDCYQPTGTVSDATDCDDASADTYPGAEEVCDSADNDCDGDIDEEATDARTWYADSDGDGFGDRSDSVDDCDRPSGYVSVGTDCDDTNADVNRWADEVCNGIDDDCDGDIDDADSDLDTSTADTWYADADGDGYGDAATSATACDEPSGYTADDTDCDDADADVNPGATELCNWEDEDCDGTADNGLADDDGSGIADCKEVAVILTYGFQASGSGGSCDGGTYIGRELQQVEDYLDDMGLTAVPLYDDRTTGISYSEISYYPVVIYHNGGWSSYGSLTTVESLEDAADADQGLLFLGDDVMKHAYNNLINLGTASMFDLPYVDSYSSNGAGTVSVGIDVATGDVMDGVYGAVDAFDYYADMDAGAVPGLGETVLMSYSSGTYPAVWSAEDGDQRTVTAMVSAYNSHDCPISDSDGLDQIEVLFKNSVWWLGGW